MYCDEDSEDCCDYPYGKDNDHDDLFALEYIDVDTNTDHRGIDEFSAKFRDINLSREDREALEEEFLARGEVTEVVDELIGNLELEFEYPLLYYQKCIEPFRELNKEFTIDDFRHPDHLIAFPNGCVEFYKDDDGIDDEMAIDDDGIDDEDLYFPDHSYTPLTQSSSSSFPNKKIKTDNNISTGSSTSNYRKSKNKKNRKAKALLKSLFHSSSQAVSHPSIFIRPT